jgi:hypothetical protein
MLPELERLLPLAIAILGLATLVLLMRAMLGVNTTHEKLDEILRELHQIKSKRPEEHDPSPSGSEDKSAPGGE